MGPGGAPGPGPRRGQPGPLPWQLPLCSLILGLLALRFPWPALAGGVLFLLLSGPARPSWRWVPACALAFALGWGLAAWAMPRAPQEIPVWMQGRRVADVTGRVRCVQTAPGGRLRVLLEDARYALDDGEEGTLPGLFLWTWQDPTARPHPGQSVGLRTRVRPVRGFANPGTWDSAFFWARQNVFYRGWTKGGRGHPSLGPEPLGAGERLRAAMLGAVTDAAPPGRGRALLAALVLGDRSFLDSGDYETVRRSTLAHSLALSGMHLGFAAGLGLVLAWLAGRARPEWFLRLPRQKLAVLLGAPPVALYVWLGGATPSLARAGVMFAAWGALLLLGRRRVLLDGLMLALVLILALDPLAVYDVRLQFSAVAVAGIGALWPLAWPLVPWERAARGRGPAAWAARAARGAAGVLLCTLCANLALTPLLVWNFGEAGLALYLNALWLPVLGLAAVPAGLVGVVLGVVPGLEAAGRALLHLDAALLARAMDLLARMDGAGLLPVALPMRPLWPHLVGWYGLLAGALVLARTRSRTALAVCLLSVGLMAWPGLRQAATGEDRRVALTVLDAGQSQAVLLDLPDGRRVLVDGGGSYWDDGVDVGQAVVAQALSRGRWPDLSLMVLSHPDADHYRGLFYPLEHLRVAGFAHGGRWPDGEHGQRLRGLLEEGGVPVRELRRGQTLLLTRELALEVLHPDGQDGPGSNNDVSLVLRLVWRGRGLALLPGDLEEPGLAALLATDADLSADVLVAPHHGSSGSLSPELYDRVAPRLTLAATGFINYLHFPSPLVGEALAARGAPLYDTGACGALRVVWDGPDAAPRAASALGCADLPVIP